ncbi:MAG TPA: antitoxin family protein [Pirellulales bacterium]|nr:antitoxin family protein [Pirellulales bacterium]
MNKPFQAIYEAGVLKPLEPLLLAEHELVSLVVEQRNGAVRKGEAAGQDDWVDHDAVAIAEREGQGAIPLDQLREQLKSISGSLADVVITERGEY